MKNISTQIQNILQKDMDRKEFLKLSGASLLGVIGITKVLSSIEKFDSSTSKNKGYGSSTYGN